MKLVTLIENESCREELTAEHGLSIYLEVGDRKLLFDAGETGAFMDNAAVLGVDLSQVDTAILSHGHKDHSGGMERFLAANSVASLYLTPGAMGEFYNAAGENIGLSCGLKGSNRLVFAEGVTQLGEGLTLISGDRIPEKYPVDCAGLTQRQGDVYCPDKFYHEQYLLVEEAGKRILISGCSHRGILNIAEYFRPDVLVGGFHFMKEAPDSPMVTGAAEKLLVIDCIYYTGHCTGLAQYDTMKKIMADRLEYLSTGRVLTL